MTKLEQEICNVLVWDTPGDNAKAAAEVAEKYIIEALAAGGDAVITEINSQGMKSCKESARKWLKENGII